MEFKTSDICLAATLKHKGVKLIGIDMLGKKGVFRFDSPPTDLLEEFNLSTCLVEPVDFNNQIKQLTTTCKRLSQPT